MARDLFPHWAREQMDGPVVRRHSVVRCPPETAQHRPTAANGTPLTFSAWREGWSTPRLRCQQARVVTSREPRGCDSSSCAGFGCVSGLPIIIVSRHERRAPSCKNWGHHARPAQKRGFENLPFSSTRGGRDAFQWTTSRPQGGRGLDTLSGALLKRCVGVGTPGALGRAGMFPFHVVPQGEADIICHPSFVIHQWLCGIPHIMLLRFRALQSKNNVTHNCGNTHTTRADLRARRQDMESEKTRWRQSSQCRNRRHEIRRRKRQTNTQVRCHMEVFRWKSAWPWKKRQR